jgi:hypothetical protein
VLLFALVLTLQAEVAEPSPEVAPADAKAAPGRSNDERLDHRGAVGLLMSLSWLRKEASSPSENTWRGGLDIGASFNVNKTLNSNEIIVAGNVSVGQSIKPWIWDGQLYGGYRGYFGERWKTFYDLDLALAWDGRFTVGPRFGVGIQYELSPIAGMFLTLHAQIGFGQELVLKGILAIGFQLRSYLLE